MMSQKDILPQHVLSGNFAYEKKFAVSRVDLYEILTKTVFDIFGESVLDDARKGELKDGSRVLQFVDETKGVISVIFGDKKTSNTHKVECYAHTKEDVAKISTKTRKSSPNKLKLSNLLKRLSFDS